MFILLVTNWHVERTVTLPRAIPSEAASSIPSPATAAIQRRCEDETMNWSRATDGLLESMMVTLLQECVLVPIQTVDVDGSLKSRGTPTKLPPAVRPPVRFTPDAHHI